MRLPGRDCQTPPARPPTCPTQPHPTQTFHPLQGFDAFKATLESAPGSGASRVDLVLSCVDNYEARMTINQAGAGWRAGSC